MTSEFFEYSKDGFGDICTSVEELKRNIKKCIDNNGNMEDKYIKRVDQFFIFHDFNHCQRIYNEIMQGNLED